MFSPFALMTRATAPTAIANRKTNISYPPAKGNVTRTSAFLPLPIEPFAKENNIEAEQKVRDGVCENSRKKPRALRKKTIDETRENALQDKDKTATEAKIETHVLNAEEDKHPAKAREIEKPLAKEEFLRDRDHECARGEF